MNRALVPNILSNQRSSFFYCRVFINGMMNCILKHLITFNHFWIIYFSCDEDQLIRDINCSTFIDTALSSNNMCFKIYSLTALKFPFQTTLGSLMKGGTGISGRGEGAWLFLQKLISRCWNKRWKVQELKEYRFSTLEIKVSCRL